MTIPACRIEPIGDFQFSFRLREIEVTRWCFSPTIPRPYFFPVNGPIGKSLTRMGHPGAPNHDHHRSLWFAHNDVMGQDFWSENKPGRISQSQWYAIDEQDDFARLGLQLVWTDGHDPKPLIKQDLFVTLRPAAPTWTLELQSDFRAGGEGVSFKKNNFGVLGLRVAKSLSAVFGEGQVTGSNGSIGESTLFGQANRWLDYSGPILQSANGQAVVEGVTLIDHCDNPQHPVKWHVRDDGWIGPSLSRDQDVLLDTHKPLTVRYLLYVHSGRSDPARANQLADQFDTMPAIEVLKGFKPHHQWELKHKSARQQ